MERRGRVNWLERARREIGSPGSANTAKRSLMAVTAVSPLPGECETSASIGSNGREVNDAFLTGDDVREDFAERAAIMEYDGALPRADAERAAWEMVSKRYRIH
jgi:hypothetical protein